MKRIVLAAAVAALAGCSSALTDETYSKEAEIKLAYKAETNESLPTPDMDLFCGRFMDDSCYIHAWQYTFNENIKIYRDKQKALAEAEQAEQLAEQEKACRASPDCMKSRETARRLHMEDQHKSTANQAYSYFTGRYAINGDEYDYMSRELCDGAIAAQKNGATLHQVVGAMTRSAGGDYTDRMFLMELAKSCWSLGGFGVTSSKDIFPSRPY